MNHDFESAHWAEHRHQLSDAVADFFSSIMRGFDVLAAIEYDAPWQRQNPAPRGCE